MMQKNMKQWFSVLLFAVLVIGLIPVYQSPAIIANAEEGNLCKHHTEHTWECGYAEAEPAVACGHVHDETCGGLPAGSATGGSLSTTVCTHEHDAECGYKEAVARTQTVAYMAPVTGFATEIMLP